MSINGRFPFANVVKVLGPSEYVVVDTDPVYLYEYVGYPKEVTNSLASAGWFIKRIRTTKATGDMQIRWAFCGNPKVGLIFNSGANEYLTYNYSVC